MKKILFTITTILMIIFFGGYATATGSTSKDLTLLITGMLALALIIKRRGIKDND